MSHTGDVLPDDICPEPEPIELNRLSGRTFLLGNEGGFVLYLPVTQGVDDRTMHAIKWFGASGFGRAYLEDARVWLLRGGSRIALNHSNQTGFTQEIDRVVLTFDVEGCAVRQTYSMPNRLDGFVMTLEADGPASFEVEPQFDMRYYQAFDDRLDGYLAEVRSIEGRPCLWVTNHVEAPAPAGELFFFSMAGSPGEIDVALLPPADRWRPKVYLKDERRERAIEKAYAETEHRVPDQAPIWDRYETTAYAPARLTGTSPLTLCFAFSDRPEDAHQTLVQIMGRRARLRIAKRDDTLNRLCHGPLQTGNQEVDCAYQHVLMQFNNGLVARDVKVHEADEPVCLNAIFAGNKYFLDAWKRDENISLIALLKTGDYTTSRAILADTWRYQDQRTGRLPHIIRLGEPLVYFSSDGTLWALQRLWLYTRMTGDLTLLDEKYPMVEWFFERSLKFARRGLLPSGGIIDRTYLWETWMDTPFTPRDGYPVEIELLWLTVLEAYLPVFRNRNPQLAEKLEATLDQGRKTFGRFILDGYLADSLAYEGDKIGADPGPPRDLLTPNGYMAFGLMWEAGVGVRHSPFAVRGAGGEQGKANSEQRTANSELLPADLQASMVKLARDQLAGRCGVRGLAPRDWPRVLSPAFLADPHQVRGKYMASVGIYNYHRGIEWLWLNQFFVAGELMAGDTKRAFDLYLANQAEAALHRGGVAGLPELWDMHGPLGADFQAWSMAGFINGLHHFGGVRVDAIDRRITVRPCLPSALHRLSCRYQIGRTRFDLHYRPATSGAQEIAVVPIDRVPHGHTISIGVRRDAAAGPPHVSLNGEELSPERIDQAPAGSPSEAWIETPFTGRTVAVFQ